MDIYPGSIVVATAGRDKEKFFVVLSREDNFAYISDGYTRKVDVPKKKKLKHLKDTGKTSLLIRSKLESGQMITNSMIKKEIQMVISED